MNNKNDRVISMEEFEDDEEVTYDKVSVDTVLDAARNKKFEDVVIIGLAENGEFSFMSSSSDYRDIVMFCESFKYMALKQVFGE